MKKPLLFTVLFSLCIFVIGYGSHEHKHINEFTALNQTDKINAEKNAFNGSCDLPLEYGVRNIESTSVSIFCSDDVNTWEYLIFAAGDKVSFSNPTKVFNAQEDAVYVDSNGKNILENSEYDYFIRTNCNDNVSSNWVGPFSFKTLCKIKNTPFIETFNKNSETLDCWTIIDNNLDKSIGSFYGNNAWYTSPSSYEGDQAMFFYSLGITNNGHHDDWLISPTIEVDGGKYEISYYYKSSSNASDKNEFELLLSNKGIDLNSFDYVLIPKTEYKNSIYKRKILYIEGIKGNINLAWHITAPKGINIYIDLVTVKKAECTIPDEEVIIENIKKDHATFSWSDSINNNWEYYVQPLGAGEPVSSGTITNKKSITVDRINGSGGNLLPDTDYEFYLRSNCGNGKHSQWIGPSEFKTSCDIQSLPFLEGFNKNSKTFNCWRIVDNNNDDGGVYGGNIWKIHQYDGYEGGQSMVFDGAQGVLPDDWLISPTVTLDANKIYRLKYYYKSTYKKNSGFRVLASNNGINLENFKTIVIPERPFVKWKTSEWKEEITFITGLAGDVNFSWKITMDEEGGTVQLDYVLLEEIICPEPLYLKVSNIGENSVDVSWEDDFGSEWEYVVQEVGKAFPTNSYTGVKTINKSNKVTVNKDGDSLEANMEYEFYVRSDCGGSEFSIWKGPYRFRTGCSVFTPPFWEGFNNSNSSYCWEIVDVDDDIYINNTNIYNAWMIGTTNFFEGESGAGFTTNLSEDENNNDWLISPTINLEYGKTYRLKYHHKVGFNNHNNKLEVLLSNSDKNTSDFTKTLLPLQKPVNLDWEEKTIFIDGVGGNVNIGWHIEGKGSFNFFMDNIFVEEVKGCYEPLNSKVEDIENDKVTILWEDQMGGTSWEYFVQLKGKGEPLANGVSTNKKQNTITTDNQGKDLEANTDYEFYVRTICENGEYSIWKGPYEFVTGCKVFETPFYEGFNSNSETFRCWTVINENIKWSEQSFTAYEGDQSIRYNGRSRGEDWLITPTIKLDGGKYILKYQYNVVVGTQNLMEILLSSKGIDIKDFSTVLLPNKNFSANATNGWQEDMIFIEGIKGDVNIAWHMLEGRAGIYLDNIVLKKIKSCPEPYNLSVKSNEDNTVDVEWEQEGGVRSWEVIIVEYGQNESDVPIQKIIVTGKPEATINNIEEGKIYTVYVKALCADEVGEISEWSSPVNIGTKVGKNDDCDGAIEIPVNSEWECNQSIVSTFYGATKSTIQNPDCNVFIMNDVWFKFTAGASMHMLSLEGKISNINGVIYSQNCSSITNVVEDCFSLSPSYVFKNLNIGQEYYIRLTMLGNATSDSFFKLCLTSPSYVKVNDGGINYTPDNLIKNILVKSDCNLVSDVKYQAGDGTGSIDAIGYFKRNNALFPFEEGIVLATQDVAAIEGPYYKSLDDIINRVPIWAGDKEINNVLEQIGKAEGYIYSYEKYISVLEFDFTPVTDSIQFEYLFASENYYGCHFACSIGGAMFAAWLTDTKTGDGANFALVPGTEMPITLSSIRDKKVSLNCPSVNPEYFYKVFAEGVKNHDDPFLAPINYVGMTKPMKSQTMHVIPGRKYNIKFVVADFCNQKEHSSAVFINSGSFNLGSVDLGKDLLINTNNALCSDEDIIIKSGIPLSDELRTEIEWYKDGVLIKGEKKESLKVSESGKYEIKVRLTDLKCEYSGIIIVEKYPAISELVHQPESIVVCQYNLYETVVNLTAVESTMFKNLDSSIYAISYYNTLADAEIAENAILNTESYSLGKKTHAQKVYIRVENTATGCHGVFVLPIQPVEGTVPAQLENVKVCSEYIFPIKANNHYYYTEPGGQGKEYKVGDVLAEPGQHTIYLLQINSEEGCYEEISYKVNITAPVTVDIFEDKTLSCEYYELKPLSEYNQYFTESEGKGNKLYPGTQILQGQTLYVYASSEDSLCTDESSFTIDYEDCPIPRGISPNNDGLNDAFDLTPHGVENIKIYNRWGTEVYSHGAGYTNQWYGQSKSGKQLPDGTYYYVIQAHGKTRTGWVQINK